jgi:hypothetical protein
LQREYRKLTRGVMAPKQQDAPVVDAVLAVESLPGSKRLAELLQL